MDSRPVDTRQECRDSDTALLHQSRPSKIIPAQKKSPYWNYLLLDTWFFEILAMGWSVACLIAIFGVLLAYNDQKRPELAYSLSLNTAVSVLATGCKSSLIFALGEAVGQLKWLWFQGAKNRRLRSLQEFDSASRGPLGSTIILFQRREWSLVSLGAVIILLMIAFDPFLQQILDYPIRGREVSGVATVPQSRFFLADFSNDLNWTESYIKGIWSSDFPIQASCPSQNCTWPKFSSIGICSKCADITANATLNCEKPPMNETSDSGTGPCEVQLSQGLSSWTPNEKGTRLNVTVISSTDQVFVPQYIVWETFFTTQYSQEMDPDWTFELHNPLSVIVSAELSVDDSQPSTHPIDRLYINKVTECSFSICQREYEVSVAGGITSVNSSGVDYGRMFWMTSRNGEPDRDPWERRKLCWVPSSSSTDVHLQIHNSEPSETYVNTTEFAFCGVGMPELNFLDGYGLQLFTSYFDQNWESNPVDPDNENAEYIAKMGLDVVAPNIAASLTKTALDQGNFTIHGTVLMSEVVVEVRWAWLILPTLLIFLGLVFFVLAIIAHKKSGLGLWKSSILASLYHGLDEIDPNDYSTSSQMEQMAENTRVQMQYSDHVGRLMLHKSSED